MANIYFGSNASNYFMEQHIQKSIYPAKSLIPNDTRNLPCNINRGNKIPKLASAHIPLNNHHTAITLQPNSGQSTRLIKRELSRKPSSRRSKLHERQVPRCIVDSPALKRVGWDLGAVCGVEIVDFEERCVA